MSDKIIEFEDVVKMFEGRPVLDGVSFSVGEGEHVSLTGESTSGKSTIFRIITGLVKPDRGRVTVLGRDLAGLSGHEQRELLTEIEMQFQSGALFDSMSVYENIRFILDETGGYSGKEKDEIITRLLRGVNLLSARNKYPYELSGGMQKRVAVVRALATSPRLALFDEPAAGLDPVTSSRIINLIKELVAEHNMTIMVATTDVHTAMRFSERFILLRNGRVYRDAPWRELRVSEDEYTMKFLSRALNV